MGKLYDDDMGWAFGDQAKESTPPDDPNKTEVVKNYLLDKYGPQLASANAGVKPTSKGSRALQAFGSVLSREDPTKTMDAIDKRDEEARQRALAPINDQIKMDQTFEADDEKRQAAQREDIKFGKEQKQFDDDRSPDSPKSKAFQEYLNEIDGKDHSHQSYADLKEISPLAEKLFAAKESAKDRALTRETNATNKGIASDAKQQTQDEKTFNDAFQTALGVKRGASSGLYGLAMKNTAFAENGLRNLDMIRSGKIVGNEQVAAELSADLNRLLSGGGQGADSGIKRLIPESLWGDTEKIKQYILGNPQQFLTPKFMDQMQHQFTGQRDFWKDQRDKVTGGSEVMLEPVFKRNPAMKERWERYWTTPKDEKNEDGGSAGAGDSQGGGLVRMKDPQGNIRMVNPDQVPAAIKAGGKLAG